MDSNIIVLTTGLSGSSVTTALIAQTGLYLGEETIVKNNSSGQYDTFENKELVELNKNIYDICNFVPSQADLYDETVFKKFEAMITQIDVEPFTAFIEKCDENGPWLWKDPRMWNTIGFWLPLVKKYSKRQTQYVVLSREPLSLWISLLLKRNIVEYNSLKNGEERTKKRLQRFLELNSSKQIELNYNDLLLKPDESINKLNINLSTNLNTKDLDNIFTGEFPTSSWRWRDLIKATLIYIKNIKEAKAF